MCNHCNGTGGTVSDYGYYATFEPCPNQECREQARVKAYQDLADLQQRFGIEPDELLSETA